MSQYNEKKNNLIEEFNKCNDWEEKYQKLISNAKKAKSLPEEFKTEDNKIKGCQSQVWINVTYEDSKLYFLGDSDALLVKGIVVMLTELFSGLSPDEVLAADISFIKEIGFDTHLTPSRANGLQSMLKQIKFYALAYKLKK